MTRPHVHPRRIALATKDGRAIRQFDRDVGYDDFIRADGRSRLGTPVDPFPLGGVTGTPIPPRLTAAGRVDPFVQLRARWAEDKRKQRLARLTGVGACAVSAVTVLYFALQLARAL